MATGSGSVATLPPVVLLVLPPCSSSTRSITLVPVWLTTLSPRRVEELVSSTVLSMSTRRPSPLMVLRVSTVVSSPRSVVSSSTVVSTLVFTIRSVSFAFLWLPELVLKYATEPVVLVGNLEGSFLASFFLGWGVTIGAGLASYPLDTIRRRMMMTSGSTTHYKSMFDAGSQIVAKEGAKSLFKGAGANILRGVAGAGVLSLYDKLQEVMFGKVYSGGKSK